MHLILEFRRAGSGYKLSFEYDNDILPKTDWLDSIPPTPPYSTLGKHTIKIIVKDSVGAIDTTSVDIYVQELIQITPTNTTGASQDNIDWSRDGTNRIAFEWRGSEPGALNSIYVLDYMGGTIKQISFSPDTSKFWADHFPEWSPDGNKIACYSQDGLNVIDLNSGKRALLREDGQTLMLSWSPNGRWLFYRDIHGQTIIYDFTTDSTEVFSEDSYLVGWSPDGSRIAVCNRAIYDKIVVKIIDFTSRNVLQEFAVPTHGYKLDWSPDGRWISLGFDYRYNAGFILDIETGRVYSWTPGNLVAVWYPSWSEDGSLLAFEALEEIEGIDTWTSIWAITFPEELR